MSRLVLLVCSLLSGCAPTTAIIAGRKVARLDLELTGRHYSIRHRGAHPLPGGPSSNLTDAGGSLSGRSCGMDLEFDVGHRGDHLQLIGFIDGDTPAQLQVREESPGVHLINGKLGRVGVEYKLAAEWAQGYVGTRVFSLAASGDALAGHMKFPGLISRIQSQGQGAVPILVAGRGELWSIPPAAQALIFTTLMTCWMQHSDVAIAGGLNLQIGGPPADAPRSSSSLYRGGG